MPGLPTLLTICAVVATSLAGCSDDGPGPTVLSSASSRPSASAAISPAPTALTPQGAAAFARYFFEVVEAAYLSGDVTTLRAASAPTCVTCNRYVDSITSTYRDGGRFEGGDFTVQFAEAPAFTAAETSVDVVLAITETRELDASGKVVNTDPAQQRVRGELDLVTVGGAWAVAGFTIKVQQ